MIKKILAEFLISFTLTCQLFADQSIVQLKKIVQLTAPLLTGWCSEEKAHAMLDLVLNVKPKVCVEIGVFGGASLLPMAFGLKYLDHGVIIGIDPWDYTECIKYLDPIEDKEHVEWWSKIKLKDVYNSLLDKLLIYDLEDYCIILKQTSEQASVEIDHIDILHIDGHRSEKQSVDDVTLYLPKVTFNGYIWLNDALKYNKQKAIGLLLNQCEVVKVLDEGNCLLFKKNKTGF
ncbi:MAG TPA: class I SAM-dependent methyltransferase [Rhabdochlamydiaceae bacterium]|jgi:hypothetical protein